MIRIISFLLIIMVVVGFTPENSDMKKYYNSENGVSISYPIDWELLRSESVEFILRSPSNGFYKPFRENVNLIIEKNGKQLSLPNYVPILIKQLKTHLPLFEISSIDYKKINNIDFARIVYTYRTSGLNLKVMYNIGSHNGNFYNFTCSTTTENYSRYIPLFNKIIKSFSIDK